MKINIAHLYYDILNLYGSFGDLNALKKEIENQGIECNIHFLTIEDKIDFDKFDLYYIASGTENNESIVLSDLIKYKNDISKSIKNGKYYLISGNGIEFFGKRILKNNEEIKALGVFDFEVSYSDKRNIKEVIYDCSFLKKPVIGFQNKYGNIINNKHVFLKEISTNEEEGILYKNFYGTYTFGPLLIRNPELLEYFTKKLISDKYNDFKFKKFNLQINTKAYNAFIENNYKSLVN